LTPANLLDLLGDEEAVQAVTEDDRPRKQLVVQPLKRLLEQAAFASQF
jgi:hypothetical protein